MSITGKIRLGLAIILGFFVLQFLLGQYLGKTTLEKVDFAVTKNFTAAEKLSELSVTGQQIRRYEKEYFIYVNDDAGRKKYRTEWTNSYESLNSKLNTMIANKETTFSGKDTATMADWKTALDFYSTEFNKIMTLADAGQVVPPALPVTEPAKPSVKGAAPVAAVPVAEPAGATKIANGMIGAGKDKFRDLLDGADKMRKAKIAESRSSVAEINSAFSNTSLISLAIFVLGVAIAIYLMISVPSSVKKPIGEFVLIADAISKGDTKQMIHATSASEFEGLAKALERLRVAQAGMVDRLRSRGN
jgi:methyl-accepting chemotaxis protein